MSNHSLPARGTNGPFSNKSAVSVTHEQNIIGSKTLIWRQLLRGHVVGSGPMKRKEKIHWMIILIFCYRPQVFAKARQKFNYPHRSCFIWNWQFPLVYPELNKNLLALFKKENLIRNQNNIIISKWNFPNTIHPVKNKMLQRYCNLQVLLQWLLRYYSYKLANKCIVLVKLWLYVTSVAKLTIFHDLKISELKWK